MWEVELYEVVQVPLGQPPVKPERRPNLQVEARGVDAAKAAAKALLLEKGFKKIRSVNQKAHNGPETLIATVEAVASATAPPARRPITPRMMRKG